MAHYLTKQGIQKAMSSVSSHQMMSHYWIYCSPASKQGAVFLPINWRLNPKEIAAIVEDSTLKLLFYAEKHLSSLNEVNPKYLHMDIDSDAYNQIVDPHNILYLKLLT